jgi:hypothetical protein
MMDFTLQKYKNLVSELLKRGYAVQTFEDFIRKPKERVVVLRHDVDRRAENAIWLGKIEKNLGVKATYYFRIVPESNQKDIIREIVDMGHEIGYHYEDLGLCRGDFEKAYESYLKNLSYFRTFYPVSTICMHGSPESKIDNRSIWNRFNYKQDGIIAEPYFDVNYDEVFYITDTGRAWNKKSVIIRDKVETSLNIRIRSIDHMIQLLVKDKLPKKLIISTHPHRWFNPGYLWLNELIFQNIKNLVKAGLNITRN